MNAQRVALVTGGMGGLGEAICKRLYGAGYQVAATYSPGNAHAVDWLHSQHEAGFEFFPCMIDVTDFASCEAGVMRVVGSLGRIDILVNNAGITRDTTLKNMSWQAWNEVRTTNLDGAFNMTKPVLHGMLENGWGRIINISSVNGQKGAYGQSNYAASKAALHGFTKALALEVASKGISVNTISPGYLRTNMVMQIPKDIVESKILPQIPMGRLGEPDEVASLVVYLCQENSGFITGANIAMNGGQHMC